MLPDDIVINRIEEVPDDFHARFSAKGKTYRYVILNRSYPSAFERDRCMQISFSLNLDAMKEAAAILPGKHDFSAFRASDCSAGHPNREIRLIEVRKNGEWVTIIVSGDAFLKHMVRNIVGTLIEVGRDKLTPADVKVIFESRDRTKAGPTAPARGLFLVAVDYE
jgi:tRNA pseudouridine38-40 synthase